MPASAHALTASAGIAPLVLPTLLGIGPVTTYLVAGDPLTLVDTGPSMLPTLRALECGLAVHGHRAADLELIVVTHQHHDHFGLGAELSERSGARVAAPAIASDYLGAYPEQRRLDGRFRSLALELHGVPPDVVSVYAELTAARAHWGEALAVDVPLADGDRLTMGGRELTVLARPGHSESDLVLLDERDGMLVAGDHLLPDVSSNATFARPMAGDPGDATGARRNPSLVRYAESLRRTRDLPASTVLPGHGAPFAGHRALVDERLAGFERRAAELAALLGPEPLSAYDLARRLWPRVASAQAALTISEVLGHVELLLRDGRAVEAAADDGIVRFVRA